MADSDYAINHVIHSLCLDVYGAYEYLYNLAGEMYRRPTRRPTTGMGCFVVNILIGCV